MKKVFKFFMVLLCCFTMTMTAYADYTTDENGYASAQIEDGITWVQVEHDGLKTWYGIENLSADDLLPDPAYFKVGILDKKDISQEYSKIIDEELRHASDLDKYLDIRIESQEGIIYSNLYIATFYIEIGDEFDINDINEMFADYITQKVYKEIAGNEVECMQIFYGIPKTTTANQNETVTLTTNVDDSNESNKIILISLSLLIVIGLTILIIAIIKKHKKHK